MSPQTLPFPFQRPSADYSTVNKSHSDDFGNFLTVISWQIRYCFGIKQRKFYSVYVLYQHDG